MLQHSRSPEQVRHRPAQAVEVRGGGVLSGYEDQVPTLLDLSDAGRLLESPFHLVSHDRIPNSLPHRKAVSTNAEVVGSRQKDQRPVGPAPSVAPCRGKVRSTGKTLVTAHRPFLAKGRIVASNRKPLASFEHATPQDVAATSAAHPRSETVYSRSASFTWLVCTFWHR